MNHLSFQIHQTVSTVNHQKEDLAVHRVGISAFELQGNFFFNKTTLFIVPSKICPHLQGGYDIPEIEPSSKQQYTRN